MLLRARLSQPSVTAVQAVGGEPGWPKTMAAASMPTPQLPANRAVPLPEEKGPLAGQGSFWEGISPWGFLGEQEVFSMCCPQSGLSLSSWDKYIRAQSIIGRFAVQ